MKRAIVLILMVLGLMLLAVMVTADPPDCKTYLLEGAACTKAMKKYQELTSSEAVQAKIKTCNKFGGRDCTVERFERHARMTVFRDLELDEKDRTVAQDLGVSAPEGIKEYEARHELSKIGMGLPEVEVGSHFPVKPPEVELDGLAAHVRTGSAPVGFDNYPEYLEREMWSDEAGRVESGFDGLSRERQGNFIKKRVAGQFDAFADRYLAEAKKGGFSPDALRAMRAERDRLERKIPDLEAKYGRDAAQAARRLVSAIDSARGGSNVPSAPSEASGAGEGVQQPEIPVSDLAVEAEASKKIDWLKCPDGCDYQVQKGDSYWSLAKRIPDADIKMEALMEMNEGKPLIAGVTTIRIPSKDEFLGYVFKKEKYFSPFQCRG